MKNHVDQWCKEHCDPRKIPDLEKVIDTNQMVLNFVYYLQYLVSRSTQKYVSKPSHGFQNTAG